MILARGEAVKICIYQDSHHTSFLDGSPVTALWGVPGDSHLDSLLGTECLLKPKHAYRLPQLCFPQPER